MIFILLRFDFISRDLKSRIVILSITFGGFLVPFGVVIVFYILVLVSLKTKGRQIGRLFRSNDLNNSFSLSNYRLETYNLTQCNNNSLIISDLSSQRVTVDFKLKRMLFRRELRATKTVILCISLFGITWLPYVILILFCQFENEFERFINPVTLTLPSLFAKTSTIFNPLIYTLVNPECKSHIKRLLGIKVI